MSAFFDLYGGLEREGPGLPEDVLWALGRLDLPGRARICDAGCGSGADTATLAETCPEATITAVEQAAPLARSAERRLAQFGARVEVREGDMAAIAGSFDLIWCAGALYFLGVTEGLTLWRDALAPGGRVVFSEPCLIRDTDAARRFWRDYPALGDLADIAARIEAAGFRLRARREISGAPWAAYYRSLEGRIAALKATADPDLAAVLAEAEAEIADWRAAPGDIAYMLLIVEPA